MSPRTPSWWPADAVVCVEDLVAYRLVGASACADRITGVLAAVAVESQSLGRSVVADVQEAGSLLCALKPDTALYRNIVRLLVRAADDGGAQGVRRACRRLSDRRLAAREAVVRVAVGALADAAVVLVHDYSSTVVRILEGLDTARRVVVTSGEPLGQGLRVARLAAAAGHAVIYTPDMSVGRVIGEVDAFVTGVESFYLDGSLSNTVGTLSLGLLCRHAGVPVVAPAELLKWQSDAVTAGQADLDARLLRQWPGEPLPDGSSVVDFVLDAVPAELVSSYATEEGTLEPSQVASRAASAFAALMT